MSALTGIVEDALRGIEDPCGQALGAGWSIFDLGLVVEAERDGGRVAVEIVLTDPLCPFFEALEERISAAVLTHTDADEVEVHVSERVAWDPSRLRRPLWADATA